MHVSTVIQENFILVYTVIHENVAFGSGYHIKISSG